MQWGYKKITEGSDGDVDASVRLGGLLAEFGIEGHGYPPVYMQGLVDVVEVTGGLGTFF
jgi:hypothetical protein